MAAFPYQPLADEVDAASLVSRGAVSRADSVVCVACGCRLEERAAADGSEVWYHYAGTTGHDARGCSIECSGAAHDASGSPLARA